eukprot:1063252-Rhodomonas_salina.1
MEADCPVQQHSNNKFAFPAASKLLHHLLEEILHHWYNHAPIEKLAHLNCGKVTGLPHPVRVARATKVKCWACDEANATRQDYPPASNTVYTADNELW